MSNWKPWEDPNFKKQLADIKAYSNPSNIIIFPPQEYIETPKWTMCKDGLPSPHQDVLACDKAGAMEIGRVFRAQCGSYSDFFVENDYRICYGIIAWMPLPIPPKGV